MPLLATFAGASARGLGFQAGVAEIPGLQLISTQSFTSVTSVDFDNVFSNDYVQYKIVIDATVSSGTYGAIRLRTGGVTNSGSIYNRQYFYGASTTVAAGRSTSQNNWAAVGASDGTSRTLVNFEILNPFQSTYTSAVLLDNYSRSLIEYTANAYGTNVTTSFDGFQYLGAVSSLTGSISVHGYYKG